METKTLSLWNDVTTYSNLLSHTAWCKVEDLGSICKDKLDWVFNLLSLGKNGFCWIQLKENIF